MYFSHWLQEWAFRGSTAIDGLLPVNPSAHLIMGLQWVQKNDCFHEQTAGYRSSHGSACVGRHSLLRARLVWFEPWKTRHHVSAAVRPSLSGLTL